MATNDTPERCSQKASNLGPEINPTGMNLELGGHSPPLTCLKKKKEKGRKYTVAMVSH